jgi:A/G-specific adenine glycosylase
MDMNGTFINTVWDYYKTNKRNFPWRETENPYYIFLSEICLQQTQTSRVIEKYQELIQAFPTLQSLAEASFSTVLSHWSGLGYNRRAKYLKEAAQILCEKHDGVIPNDVVALDALPGVGVNTAAAIVVYSFNTPVAFIETNIRRVYIHHFFSDKEEVSDRDIVPIVAETMDRENPREWFWALMDYGSYLSKVVVNPNRKSKQYAKQSTFTGSVRQVRGSLLRILLVSPQNKPSLLTLIEGNPDHLDQALGELMKEKMLVEKDGVYSLA